MPSVASLNACDIVSQPGSVNRSSAPQGSTGPTPTLPDRASPHLSFAELACKDGTPYPAEWFDRAAILAGVFEQIRAACGDKPITIGSAYRTPEHNARVGGSKRSQHCEGRALDLYPPAGMSPLEFYKRVRRIVLAKGCPVHGLGRYPRFVHIDIRERADGRVTVWSGTRAWAEMQG